jgi:hypothetical protein
MYDPIERDGMDEDAIGSEMEIHGGKYHGGGRRVGEFHSLQSLVKDRCQ